MLRRIAKVVAQVAAGVWLGAMVQMAIVAPTTFSTSRELGLEHPNYVAGRIMARNFGRFDKLQAVCAGGAALGVAGLMILSRRRPWGCTGLLAATVVVFAYSALRLTPQITGLQGALATGGDEAVRKVFAGFHDTAVRLAQLNLVLLAALNVALAWRRPEPEGVPA